MKKVSHSMSRVEPRSPGRTNSASRSAASMTARLLAEAAKRWQQRAQFYERHRDYFPRLSTGRFVGRCHELEATYRGLAQAI